MEFKDNLKKLRKKRGLSQVGLAEKLGFSKSLIGLYETGERKPSFEALEAIADFFNISLDYLMGKDDKSVYYLDPEVAEMAQDLYDRKETRVLFDIIRKTTKEDIERIAEILKKYRILDQSGKDTVDVVLDAQYSRCSSSNDDLTADEIKRIQEEYAIKNTPAKKNNLI